jgi:hypothetical protein
MKDVEESFWRICCSTCRKRRLQSKINVLHTTITTVSVLCFMMVSITMIHVSGFANASVLSSQSMTAGRWNSSRHRRSSLGDCAISKWRFRSKGKIINHDQHEAPKQHGASPLSITEGTRSLGEICRGGGSDASLPKDTLRRRNGVRPSSLPKPVSPSSTYLFSTRLNSGSGGGEDDDDVLETKQRRRREWGMSAALFCTYFAVMGAKCALPSTFSYLVPAAGDGIQSGLSLEGTSFVSPNLYLSQMLTRSTLAIAAGKFLLGPVIDLMGGIRALQITLGILCGLLWSVATTHSFQTFGRCWVGVDFMFSATWAACLSAIHQSFDPNLWVGKVSMLATAARSGNAVAFAGFASVLSWLLSTAAKHESGMFQLRVPFVSTIRLPSEQAWRFVFGVSAAAQLIPLALVTIFGRGGGKKEAENYPADTSVRKKLGNNEQVASSSTSSSSPWKVMRTVSQTTPFWFHFMARSALMVFVSFLLFVPTYAQSAYGLTSASAARVASLFALGCLASVTLVGSPRVLSPTSTSKQITRVNKQTRHARIMCAMCVGATASSLAQLGHVSSWYTLPPLIGANIGFAMWGFFAALPFYIPASLYALEHGGKEGSATLSDAFDIGGFALLAKFNGYVASIPHDQLAAWKGTFVTTSACAAIAAVTLSLAITSDEPPRDAKQATT